MTILPETPAANPAVQQRSAQLTRWLGAAVVVVAVLAFSPVLGHGFLLWDDGVLITANPDINPPAPSHWAHYWTGPTRLYMPLTYAVWGALSMVAGTATEAGGPPAVNPTVFHAASLLLHGVNALLVFLLLRRLTRGQWPAFFGSLLFAVHPLQTESVAWISETSILLSAMFSLGAILEFDRFAEARWAVADDLSATIRPQRGTSPAGGRALLHYALGTAAMALALFSKPSAVVAPILVLIIQVFLRRRSWRRMVLPLGLWCVMCLPIAYITHLWQTTEVAVPLWQRPIVAADALAFYLYKLFLPVNLLAMYGRTPQWLFSHGVFAFTWIAPAAVLVICLILWKRARWVGVAAMLFAAALLPVLGLNVFVYQHISTTADRYVYLSMAGPALLLAFLLARLSAGGGIAPLQCHAVDFSKRASPDLASQADEGGSGGDPSRISRGAAGFATALILILIGLSLRQSTFWSDTVTLFSRVVAVHPDCRPAQELVALGYSTQAHEAADRAGAQELLEQACIHYQLAAALPGDNGISLFNAANCQFGLHRLNDAIQSLRAALNDSNFDLRANAYDLMGACYLGLHDPGRASECFGRAVNESQKPEQAGVHESALHHLQRMQLFDANSSATRPSRG